MQVIKRDGRVVNFNQERIVKAITMAMAQTTGGVDIDLANKIANAVERQLEDKNQASVYEIQDLVEKRLMASSRKEVAQSYITYRYNRDVARKSKTKDIFLDIIGAKANDITRENANMNATYEGVKTRNKISPSYFVKLFINKNNLKEYVDSCLIEYDKNDKPVCVADKDGNHDGCDYNTNCVAK